MTNPRKFRMELFQVVVLVFFLIGGAARLPAQVTCSPPTDCTPPDLQEFSFSPTTVDVSAGPQTIYFTARFTDDLSGVQMAYATFLSPSGNYSMGPQFFFDSGGPLDGIWKGTLTLPRYSEGGTWRLRDLVVYDNVEIWKQYTGADLEGRTFPITFFVTGGPDLVPPELKEFDFNPRSITVSGGSQTVTLLARFTDDLSGVTQTDATFVSPSGKYAWGVQFRYFSGGGRDVTFQGKVTFPQYIEGGTWFLRDLHVYDGVWNCRTYTKTSLQSLGFPVYLEITSEPVDSTPPLLKDFSLTPGTLNVSSGPATVTITAEFTDDLSGVMMTDATLMSPSGMHSKAVPFFSYSGSGRDVTFQGRLTFSKYDETGAWYVRDMHVYDMSMNCMTYGSADLKALGYPSGLQVVENLPPVANAGPDKDLIVHELTTFDGSGSYDPDGTVVSYHWDFGDGTSAEGPQVSHAYLAAGTYTATLTVVDNQGATATDTVVVVVHEVENAITTLSHMVADFNLKQGITDALDAKLQNALDALSAANAGQRQDVANKMQAFINSVEAQRGKELENAEADALESLAKRILGVL